MRPRRPLMLAAQLLMLTVVAVAGATAAAPPAAWMYDEKSYDALTYSAWGRLNAISAAQCTGLGKAGKRFEGATHSSFRCDVQVGGVPAGSVVANALGPESLRVVTIKGGKLKPDRGIGAVPKGPPAEQDIDAVIALQKSPWAKARKISRVLCFGLGPYRDDGISQYFFAFSCATFDNNDRRSVQVLVTAVGKRSVRVVRVLA
jgi:hypothetical protein